MGGFRIDRYIKFNLRLDCVAQNLISANQTSIGGLNLTHLRRRINSVICRLNLRRTNVIDIIVTYSLMVSRSFRLVRILGERPFKPHRGGFVKKSKAWPCSFKKQQTKVLLALRFYANGNFLQGHSFTAGFSPGKPFGNKSFAQFAQ